MGKNKHKQLILVIDDDPDIIQTIKGNLVLDGYDVICALDGRHGIEMSRSKNPDLIVLDLNLPDIDGIKVCEIIRRELDTPIIMLSARDAVSDKVLGLQCGSDDYMVKPFNYLELSARIKAVLQRISRTMLRNKQSFKGLTVDFKSRKVTLGEKSVKLTKTEFELLELFISYPGETLSRDFIQKQIWLDSQLYTHSRALDVHIQRLRKKIEEQPESPSYIVTVAGVGYKFMV
ncbi:putative transcriptional regulator ycf27 [Desulfamplus magnetovallimortis]|uniref:Phosphate regulon transcriptional regulatory protein PhoB n=1 Tax=Desulfamplus magnetovallimortis TaxID=1246637 RepID=A0A1W1HC40_9BACT|nr:response regulator transcription factor [Desulfamplus magnetovallimortis]SLM30050.1 putative transcriptional regulator ycf27 [Desulfamplus magnetovallimortis]